MKDFKLTVSSLGYFIAELTKIITSNPNKAFRVNIKAWRESRSLSQNAFQHVIYSEISKYLIKKGRTDWSDAKVKFEMKSNFLGWVNTECTNVSTGEVTTRQVLKSTSGLDAGEACDYITKLLDFANNIGCFIRIPANSDYQKYIDQQNR